MAGKLNNALIKAMDKKGRHADGGGLYLAVRSTGRKNWVYLYSLNGKRREMGLGVYPEVSLAEARRATDDLRRLVRDGVDPLDKSDDAKDGHSFESAADAFISAMESSWRNAKHRAQWRATLDQYAAPIASKDVGAITASDVLACLTPIWQSKPETASRVRGRIERVLDYAAVQGWREGDNPARWRGHLDMTLPKAVKLSRGHHKAMPWQEVPAFFASLGDIKGSAAKALAFLILTAARSGEVRQAIWDEVDLSSALWTVPADRMKTRREHRVPLSAAAIEILEGQRVFAPFVFPGARIRSPLSDMALTMLVRRQAGDRFTVHGFRSSFRDWAADADSAQREVAEQALAHVVGSKVERAYRRGDALEARRGLMDRWAAFVTSKSNAI